MNNNDFSRSPTSGAFAQQNPFPMPQQPPAALGQPAVSGQVTIDNPADPDVRQDGSPGKKQSKQEVRRKLRQAIGDANDTIHTASTVFPFTLFPDTITIDRSKVDISHRSFFRVAEVTSIRIEDILNTIAHVGPIFGSIKITTRFFGSDKEYAVNYLWRGDALRIKRIVQGYIIALQKKIDCSALSTKELSKLLNDLGAGTNM